MELRHLRYFVAVAEELNFTRAAKRLGINQPPLSLQIRQLEKEMGTPLFRRGTRGVELTDAGKLLLEEARVILRQVERAKVGVKRRARGETGQIKVGSAGGTYFHPLIPAIIREFKTRYPEADLIPEASNTVLTVARLRAGQVDVAFVRPPILDSDGLILDPMVDEPTVMIVPSGHPAIGHGSALLSAFAKDSFILFPRAVNPGVYDDVIAACLRAGFTPKLGQEAPQIVSAVPLVAAGLGVAIAPQSMCRIHVEGAVCVPLTGDIPRATIDLAHRRGDRSAAVQNFVAIARRAARAATQSDATDADAVAIRA
jgi:DNA-binding transcriptional LysR family regulator